MKIEWLKDIASWTIGKTLYLSIPFTWLLPKAKTLAANHDGEVIAGGPAVLLMPDFLKGTVKKINSTCPVEPLMFHNPLATITMRYYSRLCWLEHISFEEYLGQQT